MSSEGSEKTEQPTERKKKEARDKGNIAKSSDLVGAAAFIAITMALPAVINQGFHGISSGLSASMNHMTTDVSTASIGRAAMTIAQPMLGPFAMLAGIAMFMGLAGNFAQVGLHPSFQGLKPSFQKMNPLNGFKRLISKNALFDAGKSLVKLFLFSWMTYSAIRGHWDEIGMIWSLTPLGAMGVIGNVAKSILMRLGMTWLILAVIDYAWQKKKTNKDLMMTKQEVRQEMKDAESSPEVKMAMMKRRRELSKTKTASAVRSADVIITNPTHFAVAIKYDPLKSHAPIVVAKGVDILALKIREIATEAKVPIVENRPLARALHKQCEIGDYVPRELFQSVAEVLAFVYKTVKKVRS
jgi:flagellar biosynthesis protein FlhB